MTNRFFKFRTFGFYFLLGLLYSLHSNAVELHHGLNNLKFDLLLGSEIIAKDHIFSSDPVALEYDSSNSLLILDGVKVDVNSVSQGNSLVIKAEDRGVEFTALTINLHDSPEQVEFAELEFGFGFISLLSGTVSRPIVAQTKTGRISLLIGGPGTESGFFYRIGSDVPSPISKIVVKTGSPRAARNASLGLKAGLSISRPTTGIEVLSLILRGGKAIDSKATSVSPFFGYGTLCLTN